MRPLKNSLGNIALNGLEEAQFLSWSSVFLYGANLTQIPTPLPGPNALCVGQFPFLPSPVSPHTEDRGEPAMYLFGPEEGRLTSFSHICTSSGHYPSLPCSDLCQRLNRTVRPCHLVPLTVLAFLLTRHTRSALLITSYRSVHILLLPETLCPSSEFHSLTHTCSLIPSLPPNPFWQLFKLGLCAMYL